MVYTRAQCQEGRQHPNRSYSEPNSIIFGSLKGLGIQWFTASYHITSGFWKEKSILCIVCLDVYLQH
jgi:hypothetical protein